MRPRDLLTNISGRIPTSEHSLRAFSLTMALASPMHCASRLFSTCTNTDPKTHSSLYRFLSLKYRLRCGASVLCGALRCSKVPWTVEGLQGGSQGPIPTGWILIRQGRTSKQYQHTEQHITIPEGFSRAYSPRRSQDKGLDATPTIHLAYQSITSPVSYLCR